MNILERVNEIGTLLALGAERKLVTILIVLEAFFMGVMGSILGVALSQIVAETILFLDIKMTDVPGASLPQKVQFFFSLTSILEVVMIIVISSTLAALLPLTYIMRKKITDLLAKKI